MVQALPGGRLRLNYDHQKDRRLVTGSGGSGKTTLFLHLLKSHRARWKFVYDPEREIARKLNWPVCVSVDQLVQRAAACQPVCYDPVHECGTLEDGFSFFCRWVFNVSCRLNGVKLLASDEIQDFTETGKGGIPASFKTLMQKGRRQEIDVLLITQSLGEAHDKIRGQLSHIYTLRHEDDLQLQWLKKNGFDPEAVKALKYPGGWICRNRDTGEVTHSGPIKRSGEVDPKRKADRRAGRAG